MKIIVNSLLFLLISASQCTSTIDLVEQLQGKWINMDDMQYEECPDVIFFHKSGRYIVFNDAGSRNYWLPITEKGSWAMKGKSIVLMQDANNNQPHAPITLSIKDISIERLVLEGISEAGKKYTETYQRTTFSAKLMQRYVGYGSSTEKLVLPPPGGATLLKLKHNLLSPNKTNSNPSILTIKDQDGHTLWHKAIVFEQEKAVEEILLADMPEAIELTQIIFEIHTNVGVGWELQAKIY